VPHDILASAGEHFAAGFGIAAAVLALGGLILVRLRRDRYHFDLMRTALEQGLSSIPNSIPFWLASLRQGIMILTLGLALLAVGGIGFGLTTGVPMPDGAAVERKAPPPPESEPATPAKSGKDGQYPRSVHETKRPPDPALERWHRAQRQESVSLVVMGCGAVLVPLGLVRIGFARVERRYSAASGAESPTTGT
jgi:hypothetical protein